MSTTHRVDLRNVANVNIYGMTPAMGYFVKRFRNLVNA